MAFNIALAIKIHHRPFHGDQQWFHPASTYEDTCKTEDWLLSEENEKGYTLRTWREWTRLHFHSIYPGFLSLRLA
jgi:hypothetical protein